MIVELSGYGRLNVVIGDKPTASRWSVRRCRHICRSGEKFELFELFWGKVAAWQGLPNRKRYRIDSYFLGDRLNNQPAQARVIALSWIPHTLTLWPASPNRNSPDFWINGRDVTICHGFCIWKKKCRQGRNHEWLLSIYTVHAWRKSPQEGRLRQSDQNFFCHVGYSALPSRREGQRGIWKEWIILLSPQCPSWPGLTERGPTRAKELMWGGGLVPDECSASDPPYDVARVGPKECSNLPLVATTHSALRDKPREQGQANASLPFVSVRRDWSNWWNDSGRANLRTRPHEDVVHPETDRPGWWARRWSEEHQNWSAWSARSQ